MLCGDWQRVKIAGSLRSGSVLTPLTSTPRIDGMGRCADKRRPMTDPSAWILSDAYAGLQAQAIGLAEAAGLPHEVRTLAPRPPWRWFQRAETE